MEAAGRPDSRHRRSRPYVPMNVLPVIEREMRAQARHSFTYLLRVLSATALMLAALIFWVSYGFGPKDGIVDVQLF